MIGRSEGGLVLRRWRPLVRNSLQGFADITMSNGLEIDEVAVHVAHGRAWVSLPARPVLVDGWQVETGGKKQWAALLRWRDRETAARFSAAVLELVRAVAPEALADAGGRP